MEHRYFTSNIHSIIAYAKRFHLMYIWYGLCISVLLGAETDFQIIGSTKAQKSLKLCQWIVDFLCPDKNSSNFFATSNSVYPQPDMEQIAYPEQVWKILGYLFLNEDGTND